MSMTMRTGAQLRSAARRAPAPFRPARHVRVQSGRAEPFNENAAQVKRLISRDRKEFLGNSDDILDKYETEFGGSSSQATPATPATDASKTATATAARPVSPSNPFGAPSSSNPFGTAPAAQPFKPARSAIEPTGLRPDMSPDPITKEKGFNLFESITLTQVVLFFSFTLCIALMISTFYFVLSVGGIRLNGI